MSEEASKVEAVPANNPPQGLEGLLANPELLRTLGTLIGNLSQGKGDSPTADSVPTSTGSPQSAPSADGLSALLSNPEMMEKLPQIISVLKPMMGNATVSSKESSTTEVTPASAERELPRDRLLLSLKPFLSQSRCDAIDTMLRIAQLSHVFQQLK